MLLAGSFASSSIGPPALRCSPVLGSGSTARHDLMDLTLTFSGHDGSQSVGSAREEGELRDGEGA